MHRASQSHDLRSKKQPQEEEGRVVCPAPVLVVCLCLCLGLGLCLAPGTASAQSSSIYPCAPGSSVPVEGHLLSSPPELSAGLEETLSTSLVVRRVKRCMPAWDATSGGWIWKEFILRGYGFPIDPDKPIDPEVPADPEKPIEDYYDTDTNLHWVTPGPTFRVHKGTQRGSTDGTRLHLKLYNRLPPPDDVHGHCNPAFYCKGSDPKCAGYSPSQCEAHGCTKTPVPQEFPECFHGDDVTNLHYHGTHVSPQPHQDYVLLSLYPKGTEGVPTGQENFAVGEYLTDMNPFPWNQAEGTHWYHPHKHGSTAIQVLNGMAGALLIEGPFDRRLENLFCRQLYDRDCRGDEGREVLRQQVLVVDQIWGVQLDANGNPLPYSEINLFKEDPNWAPGHALINGQAVPVVKMQRGEIQRWRFIGATMQASAQIQIGFDNVHKSTSPKVRQIAQDGVQFSAEGYVKQPILNNPAFQGVMLSPGNRVDLLVQAPMETGIYTVTHERFSHVEGRAKELLEAREGKLRARGAAAAPPALLKIHVVEDQPEKTMKFPCPEDGSCWPDEAYDTFLEPIREAEVDKTRELGFGMVGAPGAQPNCFYLGKPEPGLERAQYGDGCAFETMEVGTTEAWTVTNNSAPNHPFHIHINPFQLESMKGTLNKTVVNVKLDPPIWQDTMALPGPATMDVDAGPIWNNEDARSKCPGVCEAAGGTWNQQWTTTVPGQTSVCGCDNVPGSIHLRQRYEDFTGAYVTHCHFLGHEDRGMMQNLQTVCANGDYGKPRAGEQECVDGNYETALPACTAENTPSCPISYSE